MFTVLNFQENGIFPFPSHSRKQSSLGNIMRCKGEQIIFEEAIWKSENIKKKISTCLQSFYI